jgi:hypothetical protein
MRFSTRADTMDCAAAIAYLSVDIWVEDETGSRVADKAVNLRHLDPESSSGGTYMLTEAFHRGEAERFRRLAETASSARIKAKLTQIPDLHAKVARGLQQVAGVGATLNNGSA